MPRKIERNAPQTTDDALRLLSEKLRTAAHRPNILGYKPHEKQVEFHSAEQKNRLFIGGNRSGKTVAGVAEDIMWARGKHPYRVVPESGCRGRVVTTSFLDGVEKVILPEVARWVPISELRGNSWSSAYDKLLRTLYFENGSFIEFMSYDQDLEKFAGTSRHFVHFDEEPPKDIFIENTARLVDTGGSFWITMTPVEGMTWVFDDLYIPGTSDSLSNIKVVEVFMTENPYLGQAEVEQFIQSLDVDEREARVKGKFVQRGGLIYPMFEPVRHVIPAYIPDRNTNLWISSLDHGFNNPTAVLWASADNDGLVTVFAEHYVSGEVVDYHAKAILGRETEFGSITHSDGTPDIRIADPSIRNTDSITGTSVLEEYFKHGIFHTLANNDVGAGLVRVAQYFKQDMLRITDNCPNLIEELLRYRWATFASKKVARDHNAKETPHKKNDHACDALRYMIMSRPELSFDKPREYRPVGKFGASLTAPDIDINLMPTNPVEATQWQTDEYLGSDW